MSAGMSVSNLHEPTSQVAAKGVADPLHLHSMDTDLQILLFGSSEIFFLWKRKTKVQTTPISFENDHLNRISLWPVPKAQTPIQLERI
jgi:hypothetical protein